MIIDTKKLQEMGFTVNYRKGEISIIPNFDCSPTKELRDSIKQVSNLLGFTERDTEDLWTAAHNIQVMSTIRKCSNW